MSVSTDTLRMILIERLDFMLPLLAAGLIVGELAARALWQPLASIVHTQVAAIVRKLNRPQRNAATRVYRGIIVLGVLLAAASLLALGLNMPEPAARLSLVLLMLGIYGRGFCTVGLLRRAWSARRNQLSVPPPLADGHAVLRQSIHDSAERFTTHIVGVSFWFLVAGPYGVCVYLVLGLAAIHSGETGFGWAAHHAWRAADVAARVLACLLLGFAALFVPHTAPLAAARRWHFRWFVATLLGVSLGGAVITPAGVTTLPWAGNGTARVEATHFRRWITLRLVASLLGFLMLAAPLAYGR